VATYEYGSAPEQGLERAVWNFGKYAAAARNKAPNRRSDRLQIPPRRPLKMIARKETKTITMKPDLEEPPEERIGQQKKPDIGQFRLQVDRQTKQSYATFEAAEQAGITIKKKHPLLQVAVYDLVASVNKLIEVPKVGAE
jgi:hypothetical protein